MNLSNKVLMCRDCKTITIFCKQRVLRLGDKASQQLCFKCAFAPVNQKALDHHFIELSNPKLARLFYE